MLKIAKTTTASSIFNHHVNSINKHGDDMGKTSAKAIFITLYSTDGSTVETVVGGLDLSRYCLQVTGNRAALARAVGQNPPDLLVVDSSDNNRDMEELARLVEQITPAPPVLVLTPKDHCHDQNMSALHVLHTDSVLIKPFNPTAFIERVDSLLQDRLNSQPTPGPQQLRREKPLVLVVDDSLLQMNVMLRHLENQDLEIITAADGHAAMRIAAERVPDLVLLDLVLPGADGLEVCRRIKAEPATAEVPVIMITTLNGQEDKLNSLRHGADDFITKPVDRSELLLKTSSMLRRKKHMSTLARQASRDPLTGLYNRRYMDFAMKREMMDALSSESPLALLMLDVDHFKNYNDTNGHPAGDEVLKAIGGILTAKLRQHDIIVRYGGEEFLVLLPKTSTEGTALVAEKIRRSIDEYPFPHRAGQPGGKVTVSIGAACFPEHACDAAELLNMADEALYRAKREGRNRFRMAKKLQVNCS